MKALDRPGTTPQSPPPSWTEPHIDDWQDPQPGEDDEDLEGALWLAHIEGTL